MTAVDVSIAVLTMNRRDDVVRAINSAYNSVSKTSAVCEIIVLDNASTDNTHELISSLFSDVKLIRINENLGCPGGRNIIYENCKGSIIINLDDDGMLSPDLIEKTIMAFENNPDMGILTYRQFESVLETEALAVDGVLIEVSSFSGGLSAFRKSMLLQIGSYPKDYFLLAEEENMALRASDAGYKIMSATHIGMIHPFESQSQDNRWDFYRFRNSIFNVIELFPFPNVMLWIVLRVLSNFRNAYRRKSLYAWVRSVVSVCVFGWTRKRSPIQSITLKKYLALRSSCRTKLQDSVKEIQ
jgi:GT2 family glycosyltransferase